MIAATKDPIKISISKSRTFLPIYHHLLDSDYDIDLLYGGRDSGKSKFVAQRLVLRCLEAKYFRCVLARKVFNTIKDSQWQMIKDIVNEWGLDHLFQFTAAPLEIRCVNGNRFVCRGLDEPGKLKSLTNPSDCWVEEGNQLSREEFVVLMTSLRYNDGKCKSWFTFNPETEGDYHQFWIYKIFYSDVSTKLYKNFVGDWSVSVAGKKFKYTYQSTHSTYHDNKYVTDERKVFLEQLRDIDPYYYQVYTLGRWGNRQNDDPFCYCFNEKEHVQLGVEVSRRFELRLSFDFNINPITCGVYQDPGDGPKCVEAIQLENSDIYKLCDYINIAYPGYMFMVTGDATGRASTALVQDGVNYYTVIKTKLRLSNGQLRVPTVNPKVSENRVLVNAAFKQLKVKFDKEKAKGLIFDCMNVSVDDMGEIDKGDRSNPKKRADHLDHFRYLLNTFYKNILKIQ